MDSARPRNILKTNDQFSQFLAWFCFACYIYSVSFSSGFVSFDTFRLSSLSSRKVREEFYLHTFVRALAPVVKAGIVSQNCICLIHICE